MSAAGEAEAQLGFGFGQILSSCKRECSPLAGLLKCLLPARWTQCRRCSRPSAFLEKRLPSRSGLGGERVVLIPSVQGTSCQSQTEDLCQLSRCGLSHVLHDKLSWLVWFQVVFSRSVLQQLSVANSLYAPPLGLEGFHEQLKHVAEHGRALPF